MGILTLVRLGAAVRFNDSGLEITLPDSKMLVDRKVIGTTGSEPSGKPVILTCQPDGRRILRAAGLPEDLAERLIADDDCHDSRGVGAGWSGRIADAVAHMATPQNQMKGAQ